MMHNDTDDALRVGPIVIHPARHEVRIGDEAVALTAMEMAIIKLLATRPGVVYSPDQIADACHDGYAEVQPRSVNRRVQALRKKLGDAGQMITNTRGVGYCLYFEQEEEPEEATRIRTRWWVAVWAAVSGWWSQQTANAKAAIMGGTITLGSMAGVGALQGVEHLWPTPGKSGVELLAAAAWSPAPSRAASDRLAQMWERAVWSGIGSSLTYTGHHDEYLVLSDRGYEDGERDVPCRWHRLRIAPDAAGNVQIEWLGETILTDESGRPLRGGAADMTSRYDPEAMCLDAAGNVWIAEEYGPSIDVFSREGRRLRRLPVPNYYKVTHPHKNADRERRTNVVGRPPNRGFEAIALDEANGCVWVMIQSPLIQDGGESGRHLRLLSLSLDGVPRGEWAYVLDGAEHQVSEMALHTGKLLVLERDLKAGSEAGFKRVFTIDSTRATDIQSIASLPGNDLPKDLRPVDKHLAIDLLAYASHVDRLDLYEQFEGMTFGPPLPDGRSTLLVSTDNGQAGVLNDALMNIYYFALDGNTPVTKASIPRSPDSLPGIDLFGRAD